MSAASAPPLSWIPVRVQDHFFCLTLEGGRAVEIWRRVGRDEFRAVWRAGLAPDGTVCGVLETAGYAVEPPHARSR